MIFYLKSYGRQPVRGYPLLYGEDPQQAAPLGWCEGCGRELYEETKTLCKRCEKEKKNASDF